MPPRARSSVPCCLALRQLLHRPRQTPQFTAHRHSLCYRKSVYLDYYGLTEPPFDITPNPRFLFYSAKHREAFNHLLYGIRERKGFVQMTGEVGAGKTTLCRAMLEQLDDHYATALILNPIMSARELVKAIALEY